MKNITYFLLFLFVGMPSALADNNPTLIFATEATYPPFVSMSTTGEIGGFETELMKKICDKAHFNCTFKHLPFDSLFTSLDLKKIDVVYGAIGITEKRKQQVLFSKPFYSTPTGFILTEPFSDKTIGVQQGTIGYEDYLKKNYPNATLKTYASIQDALLDLKNKRIQAVFGDLPVFKLWVKKQTGASYTYEVLTPEQVKTLSAGSGVALRKDAKESMEKLNKAYDEVVKEGTFEKLKKEYLEQE